MQLPHPLLWIAVPIALVTLGLLLVGGGVAAVLAGADGLALALLTVGTASIGTAWVCAEMAR